MNTILNNTLKTLALSLVLAAATCPAQAAINTFVSHLGSDSAACSAVAPCATFQGALAKTDPGGVITALDSGNYGLIHITQAVTIDGTGVQANIVTNSQNIAIYIVAGSSDTIVLRHLSLTGLSGANTGVSLQSGSLEMEDCHISGFTGAGVSIASPGSALAENTVVTQCGYGIECGSTGLVSLRNVTLRGDQYGMFAAGGPVDISHSLITQNSTIGLYASQTTLSVLNCILTGNNTAVFADTGSTIRLANNDIFNNISGIIPNSTGIVSTAGNNHKAGNVTSGAPTTGKVIVTQ